MQQKYLKLMTALDSLMMDMEVRIKICLDDSHTSEWYERSVKCDYDLWVIMEGQISVIIDQEEYIMNANDVLLLTPQMLYTATCKSDTCRFAFVHFDASIGKNNRALDGIPFVGPISGTVISQEVKQFWEQYHRYRAGEAFSSLSMRGAFMMLLSSVLREQIQQSMQLHSVTSVKTPLFRVQKVFGYIDANLNQAISIDDLAALTKMSPKYFITFFKKAVGVSPAQYVLRYRMKKALEYIYEQKYTIKEIAAMVGYEDQYTFSKAFKKIYHSAPSNIIESEMITTPILDNEPGKVNTDTIE